MTHDELKRHIIEGVLSGHTVVIPRQMFWQIEWPDKKPVLDQLGELLASLRGQCIGHGIGFEGYEFFKIARQGVMR